MTSGEKKLWGIHTMDDSLFLHDGVIAIGWREMGDLARIGATREAFKAYYIEKYPDAKKGSIATSSGMLFRFIHEVQIGDYVVFPSKSDRQINLGVVEGAYCFAEDAERYVQQRKVKWLKHLPRTAFSQGALYEIGSALTFFMVNNYADEFLAALESKGKKSFLPEDGEDESVGATADDIIERISSSRN